MGIQISKCKKETSEKQQVEKNDTNLSIYNYTTAGLRTAVGFLVRARLNRDVSDRQTTARETFPKQCLPLKKHIQIQNLVKWNPKRHRTIQSRP